MSGRLIGALAALLFAAAAAWLLVAYMSNRPTQLETPLPAQPATPAPTVTPVTPRPGTPTPTPVRQTPAPTPQETILHLPGLNAGQPDTPPPDTPTPTPTPFLFTSTPGPTKTP